jgi:hypothetical protein
VKQGPIGNKRNKIFKGIFGSEDFHISTPLQAIVADTIVLAITQATYTTTIPGLSIGQPKVAAVRWAIIGAVRKPVAVIPINAMPLLRALAL